LREARFSYRGFPTTEAIPSQVQELMATFTWSHGKPPDSADLADGGKGRRQRDSFVVQFEIGSRDGSLVRLAATGRSCAIKTLTSDRL